MGLPNSIFSQDQLVFLQITILYNCIFVQLQDTNGEPARATQDTIISLSSSLTNIGTVDPSITIPKGTTYVSANFTATFSPGTTTISASATGYSTVQAPISTVGSFPQQLALRISIHITSRHRQICRHNGATARFNRSTQPKLPRRVYK